MLLARQCNASPSLTETKHERLDLISNTLQPGELYSIKDILRSKVFIKCFALASQPIASSGGDNVEERNDGGAPHVAIDEGESRHSQDDLVEYVPLGKD